MHHELDLKIHIVEGSKHTPALLQNTGNKIIVACAGIHTKHKKAFSGVLAKLRKLTISFVISVSLSVCLSILIGQLGCP
jgi:hypothetical protein